MLNHWYNFDGKSRKNGREKHKLVVWNIRRLFVSSAIGITPSKCGNKPKTSRNFLKLTVIHINMD